MNYCLTLPRQCSTYLPTLFFSGLIVTSSQSPRRTSRQRAASTRGIVRQPSTRSRLHSTSTVIIHSDTDEDEAHRAVKPESQAPSGPHPGPVTRTRKARDAQLRLGVGRPTIAGGSGPRAVTRSVSVAKGAPSRSGRGAKPPSAPVVDGASGHLHHPCLQLSSNQFSTRCAGLSLCVSSVTRHLNCTLQTPRRMIRNSHPATGLLGHGRSRMVVYGGTPRRPPIQIRRVSGKS